MKSIFYAYLIIVVMLGGCSSGKNSFERGNYYEAVITSINRLRKNSDHKKSVETLRQAYPLAVSFYEDRAKTALASAERFKWSEVVRSYTAINTMYDEIKRCPGALAVVPNPVNYFSKLQEARQNAAEEHYAAGILSLQTATRESAKQAYGYFKIANEYVAGYKEVNNYLEAALSAATVKIVVEAIPVHSKSVGVSADFFNDKISEFVHAASISEFVRFYSRAEAQKIKLNPDHIVQLEFDDFTVGQVYKHEKEIHLTKDSVVMGTYASPSAPASNNNNNAQTTSLARAGTTTASRPVIIASSPQPANPTPNTAVAPVNNQTASDGDRQNAALAEQQRQEQERVLAEKIRIEREAAEKERVTRENAEKERLAREAAEKERIARQAESEREAREAAERDRLAKERLDAERAARDAADKAAAEKALADQAVADKLKAEKDKAEKERLERNRIEKAKADKEKADREREEKEKDNHRNDVDPTINAKDTINITDPVVVCHIPPGNKANARNLKINRSALKAHLAHGDVEGGCDAAQPNEKEKPVNNEKVKPQEDLKGKPQPGNKVKEQKGAAGIEINGHEYSPRFGDDVVLFASRENNPAAFLRYMTFTETPADTNKVYGTVKAVLYHYTKTTTSKGIVSFKIIDAKTGALLSVQKMPGEFVWKSEWATFNGDERALSAEQIQLTRQKELPAPAPQELFIEFTRPIYDQITTKLKDFYKGY